MILLHLSYSAHLERLYTRLDIPELCIFIKLHQHLLDRSITRLGDTMAMQWRYKGESWRVNCQFFALGEGLVEFL